MTDNEKYVKRGQALIIRDDPQRHEEAMAANRNKVGAPFQYAESLFCGSGGGKIDDRTAVQAPAGNAD